MNSHHNSACGHYKDGHRVVVVVVGEPQTEAQYLEYVERVEDFEEEKGDDGLLRNEDFVGSVDEAPGK